MIKSVNIIYKLLNIAKYYYYYFYFFKIVLRDLENNYLEYTQEQGSKKSNYMKKTPVSLQKDATKSSQQS